MAPIVTKSLYRRLKLYKFGVVALSVILVSLVAFGSSLECKSIVLCGERVQFLDITTKREKGNPFLVLGRARSRFLLI